MTHGHTALAVSSASKLLIEMCWSRGQSDHCAHLTTGANASALTSEGHGLVIDVIDRSTGWPDAAADLRQQMVDGPGNTNFTQADHQPYHGTAWRQPRKVKIDPGVEV